MENNTNAQRLPPLNALRVFEVVARHLNFRLAAEELGVTHGAVAQQIRGLEDNLQIQLFNRLPRGLALTEPGRTYAGPIRQAMALISDATRAIQPEKTIVSISLTPSFASKWFMPRLSAFTTEHPDLEVKLNASEDLSNFQSDGIDLSVRQGTPPFGNSVDAELLYAIEYIVVCSPALMTAENPPSSIAELKNHVLLHDAHNLWPLFFLEAPELSTATLPKSLKFNQTSLAMDAAIAGQGIALVSSVLAKRDIRAGRLCQPFEAHLKGDQGYYIVTPKSPRNPKATSRMKTWLQTQN